MNKVLYSCIAGLLLIVGGLYVAYSHNDNNSVGIENPSRSQGLEVLYNQYGCDNGENSGYFNACVEKVYKILSDQQAAKYQEFINKLDNWPSNLCLPYASDVMKEAVTKWYEHDDVSASAKCSAEERITGSASTDIYTVCKLEHVEGNVRFLQELIDKSHGYPKRNGSCG